MAASPATDHVEHRGDLAEGLRERLDAGFALALLWVIPVTAAVAAFILG